MSNKNKPVIDDNIDTTLAQMVIRYGGYNQFCKQRVCSYCHANKERVNDNTHCILIRRIRIDYKDKIKERGIKPDSLGFILQPHNDKEKDELAFTCTLVNKLCQTVIDVEKNIELIKGL